VSGAELQRAYREMVQEMDKGVGEIVATLARLGLAENTLIIFTSDNGATRDGNNGPLRGLKGTVWEGGHRVPAIASWPGRIRPGTVTAATALTMDLAPTLVELAGATVPSGFHFDGTSLAPLLLKQAPLAERTLFWGYNDRYAVRRGPWKLVINPPPDAPVKRARKTEPNEPLLGLYQLDEDPRESRDVASAHPELVGELSAALAAWKDSVAPAR
jgi:arylsulfatase A-like enzyme